MKDKNKNESSIEKTALYERFNNDNILIRSVIIGLLDLLNNQIDYSQIWGDNIEETVVVPWWYNFGSSDEKFMQNNYTFFGKKCFNKKFINGTFNSIPRGLLSYSGSSIESASITNRFILGRYMKRVGGGKLISYTSFLYSIPLSVNFDCVVECDNVITALKIEQSIRDVFYKNNTFFVLYKGMKIGCTAGIPESFNSEKSTNYSFDNAQQRPKLTFNITVETYQPVFDKTTEIESSKVIKHFSTDIFVKSSNRTKSIEITNKEDLSYDKDKNPVVFPSGTPIIIEWKQRSGNSEMLDVFVSAIDECGCETVLMEPQDNTREHFIWNIPEKYSGFSDIKVNISKNDADIIKDPVIKVVPNLSTKEITEDSFVIVENGILYSKDTSNTDRIPIKLTYTDEQGKPHIITNYSLKIDNGRIDIDDPVIVQDAYAKYEGTLKPKRISLRVFYLNEKNEDAVVEDKVDNVLIL